MCKIFLTCVLVATAAITCSATQRGSWPTSSDVHRSNLQVSKYPALPKFPTTSWPVDVEPVNSWPTY